MYRRKKIQARYKILILLGGVALFLGLVYNGMRKERTYSIPEKIAKDVGYVISSIFATPIDFVSNIFTSYNEKKDLYDKYQILYEKEEKYDMLDSSYSELIKENRELKEALGIKATNTDYKVINAKISARETSMWFDVITINKGETNQVNVDMPVVSSKGLIGRIISTSYLTSTVRLITAEDNRTNFSVKIESDDNYIFGILTEYNSVEKAFKVEGIDEKTEIKQGDIVTTTGMGNMFPSGILIGKVKSVVTDNFDLGRIVYVESLNDFDDLNFIAVLAKEGEEW